MTSAHAHGTGFTLVELTIALLATSLLALGGITLAQAVAASGRLQQNLSALNENARFGAQTIGAEIRQAGFVHSPALDFIYQPFAGSMDNAETRGDRLTMRRWSNRNCYENLNTILDSDGRPAFFLRISTFEVNTAGQLAVTCYYGEDQSSLVRQLNGLGLVERVISLQAQFALDMNGDGNAESWTAQVSGEEAVRVLGVRVGLLLQSEGAYGNQAEQTFTVLDQTGIEVPGNRVYTIVETSWPVLGVLQS